jgi:amidohydrolase
MNRRVKGGAVVALALGIASCRPSADRDTTLEEIARAAEARRAQLIAVRRDIHAWPELSGEEIRTAGVVADRLRDAGLEVRTGVGGHGVVAILRGSRPGPVVAYRADMDAMPLQEPPGREHGSKVPGVFHVCGHDLHVAVGVGVADILAGMRDQLPGTVMFLFQPAEETLQGAAAMIEDGALGDPVPDVVYAIHAFPLPVGSVAHGAVFAGSDTFAIEVTGALATPEISKQLQATLASIATVTIPTTKSEINAVIAALSAVGGPLENSIFVMTNSTLEYERVVVRGSVKASHDAMYPAIRSRVVDIADGVVGEGGYTVTFRDAPFPSMVSHPQVSATAGPVLAEILGSERVMGLHATVPFASEDFALFLQRVPGAMVLVGVANHARGILGLPHMPNFDADEEGIVVGTKAMAAVLWRRLSEP